MRTRLHTVWLTIVPALVGLTMLAMIGYAIADTMREQETQARITVTERTIERVVRARCAEGVTDPRGCQRLLDRLLKNASPTQRAALQGERGAVGPRGATGTQGPSGITGMRGEPGARGTRGLTGPIGPTGPTGAGTVGPPGPPGPAGPPGTPGRPTTPGIPLA